MPDDLLSLDDARATLNLSATGNDTELQEYIAAVTSMIEARIGPVAPRTVTETVTAGDAMILSQAPVVSVSTLTGVYSGAPVVLAADVTVDAEAGIVRKLSRAGFGGQTYVVTYTAGRPGLIEPRITQAARVLLRHLWSTQRGSSTRGRGDEDTFGAAFSMPNRVLELLATDLKAPGVA